MLPNIEDVARIDRLLPAKQINAGANPVILSKQYVTQIWHRAGLQNLADWVRFLGDMPNIGR